jgi:hypothetical protein
MNQRDESSYASNNHKPSTVVNVRLPLTASPLGHNLATVPDHPLIRLFAQFLKKRMQH